MSESDDTRPTARQTVFAAVDMNDAGDGAPIGDVVEDATKSHGNADRICKVVARMLRHGELYEPKTGYVRKTNR